MAKDKDSGKKDAGKPAGAKAPGKAAKGAGKAEAAAAPAAKKEPRKPAAPARLHEKYKAEVVPALMKQFGYTNVMQVPKLVKVVLNRGAGDAAGEAKVMDSYVDELQAITGQRPVVTRARRSIAAFKLRERMPIGCKVTLRGARIIEAMANLHATQRSLVKHHPENYEQRWAEAVTSLRSAFSKPARNQRGERLFKQDASYIPNSLREAILGQSDGAAFLRVYEGLLLTGLSADELITEAEIKARLSEHGMGRPSIRKALRFRLIPSPRTLPTADADLSLADSHTKICVFVPKTKGDRSKHRPPKYYCIPSIETLCQILGAFQRTSPLPAQGQKAATRSIVHKAANPPMP